MPDKTLSVATYAAGASLATIALVYVFAPTFFLDSSSGGGGGGGHGGSGGHGGGGGGLSSLTGRKTGVVGLSNAANDCFINSVLQALAGLGDLRLYLIRETHRRRMDGAVYRVVVEEDNNEEQGGATGTTTTTPKLPAWKVEGLQAGLVTKGLKDMLDQLNERPIYRKVVSAAPFVRVLEVAFRQRISRQQQDAQEFLQVVAERLCDEYHAGRRARRAWRAAGGVGGASRGAGKEDSADKDDDDNDDDDAAEEGFPMEGQLESQIECLTCGFRPRPSLQTFCTLTLTVPQASATTLGACFDSLLKTEYIDEFRCDRCRLVHARELAQGQGDAAAAAALQRALDTDPERPPAGVALPDVRLAPKRRISRHVRLVRFPKVLAVHLSRSIYDAAHQSTKNSAKVAFPERLPLGSLLQQPQRRYRLLSVVMHKGSHYSGHYESFRRQSVAAPPYANPHPFQPSPAYAPSPPASAAPSPMLEGGGGSPGSPVPSASSSADLPARTQAGRASRSSSLLPPPAPTSAPRERDRDDDNSTTAETASLRSITRSTLSRIASSSRSASRGSQTSPATSTSTDRAAADKASTAAGTTDKAAGTAVSTTDKDKADKAAAKAARRKKPERWWRISDEKVREASTREVLGMQREVYLLFYELERPR